MKKRQRTWLLVGGAVGAVVVTVFLVPELIWRTGGAVERVGRIRVLQGDHAELRDACLEMIANYHRLSCDFTIPTDDGAKGLSFGDEQKGYKYMTDPRLPKPLWQYEPTWAGVGTNYLYIGLRHPLRSLIVADGGGAGAMISNRFDHLTVLTNGLWFCC